MAAQTDDKKLDGAGLTTLWGIIKQYIADNPSIPKATASVLGGIMVGTTLAIDNSGVLDLASGIVTAGTYKSVTVDTYGRVTAGSNPNTLAGYGITDAKIDNGAIILGADSITPATQTWVQQQGYTSNIGTVTQVKVGTSAYDPSSGVVSLPAYPTTLPASDVYSWAKASTKPSYTLDEVSDGSTRKLANYLPLSGGTMTGAILAGTNKSYNIGSASAKFYYGYIHRLYGVQSIASSTDGTYQLTLPSKSGTIAITSDIPTNNNQLTNGAGYITGITKSMVTTALGYTPPTTDTNTWRTVQCNGTSIGSNTLNLKAGTNVSLSNSNGTITITSTDTNTWRGIQNNLTSTSTSDSLSANQGRLLANGSARDDTKLPLTGGTLSGNVEMYGNSSPSFFVGTSSSARIGFMWSSGGNRGLYDYTGYWLIRTDGTNTYLQLGKVCLGSFAPDEKLHVDGSVKVTQYLMVSAWTGYGSGSTNMWYNGSSGYLNINHGLEVTGSVKATSFVNTSDIRRKNIIRNVGLTLQSVANAPSFVFTWKDIENRGVYVGTSAQYWQSVLPEVVSVDSSYLSMDYSSTALVACISVAKETLTLKEKVALLETRVESLEKKIREYESN